jgi:hypothetical protein
VWMLRHGAQSWEWPIVNEYTTLSGYVARTWMMMPMEVRRLAPFACLAAFGIAFFPGLIFARAGAAVLWSTVGVSMVLGLGLTSLSPLTRLRVQSMQLDEWVQMIVLVCAVAGGVAMQWKLTPAQLFAAKRARRPDAMRLSGKKEDKGNAKNVTVYINRAVTNGKPVVAPATPVLKPEPIATVTKTTTTTTAVAA